MAKTRVFVSYDFDNDRALKHFIIGQARNRDSPFEVVDASLKEAAPQAQWERKAYSAISRADRFIVMLGPRTRYARGVKKEIAMARGLGRPRCQIIGYKDGVRAWAVPGGGRTYHWDWELLKVLLAPRPWSFAEWWFGA